MIATTVGCDTNIVGLLAILGGLTIFLFLLDTIINLLQYARGFLAKYFLPNENLTLAAKFGKWAVVTGSTDGIGKQYAFELAARDINIVLISRNIKKLRETAEQIEFKYSVKTKIIVADFSRTQEAYQTIERELAGIPVGILVNNVGMQYSYPKYVGEASEQELHDIININVGAVTLMSKMILPQMKERRRGAIVNVSSGSELQPLPLMTVYAATKAYVKSFTEALRFEYSRFGVTVQHLSPMFINTKMNVFSPRLQETSLFVPDAITYAKYAVKTLGVVDHSTGYWAHGLQAYVKSFTEALRFEYSRFGVTVQHLSPMFINTKMNVFSPRLQETSLFVPDAITYAKYAVKTLGVVDHSTGYWAHGLQYFLTSIPPTWIRMYIGGYLNRAFRKDYFNSIKNK